MTEQAPARWVIGVDIGGTNVRVGVVPFGGGRPLALLSRPTRGERGGDATVADIGEMADEVVTEALARHGGRERVVGVGIGCPGPLDLTTGCIVETPNLAWAGYPIRERVAARVGLPATLDNDANCATYGEWWQGAARGTRHAVGVTIGTGVGGGLIVDGRLLRGASGVAGELGHTSSTSPAAVVRAAIADAWKRMLRALASRRAPVKASKPARTRPSPSSWAATSPASARSRFTRLFCSATGMRRPS